MKLLQTRKSLCTVKAIFRNNDAFSREFTSAMFKHYVCIPDALFGKRAFFSYHWKVCEFHANNFSCTCHFYDFPMF